MSEARDGGFFSCNDLFRAEQVVVTLRRERSPFSPPLRAGQLLALGTILAVVAAACVPNPSADELASFANPDPASRTSVDLSYGPEPEHLLDVYEPDGSGTLRPAIVMLHPGGWREGDKAPVNVEWLRQVDRGYVVVSVNYRLAPEDPHPAQIQDTKLAIRWIKANATQFGIDPTAVITWGASAGAQLAMVAALAPDRADFEYPVMPPELAAADASVVAAVAIAGPVDMRSWAGTADPFVDVMVTDYLGCPTGNAATCSPSVMDQTSPVSHVGEDAPPLYIAYGDSDTLVPWEQGLEMLLAYVAVDRADALWFDFIENAGHWMDHLINWGKVDLFVDGAVAGALPKL